MVIATAIFNANAYPERAKPDATISANRLSLLLHNATRLDRELSQARSDFLEHLKRNWAGYKRAAGSRADVRLTAYWHGAEYTTVLHSILYETRAFLDVYARLICRMIGIGGPPGFKSGKVDGRSVPGGRLYNWLRGLSEVHLPEKARLLSALDIATTEWIGHAVRYRDTLAHYRDIPGLRHMHVSLTCGPENIGSDDIIAPVLPDGVPVDVYVDALCEHIGRFIDSTLPFIPSVEVRLIATWDQAKVLGSR